ncbi:MAG TPA: DnaJ domain-containing protein [Candidatus Angelobacter sp.]
MAELPDYYLDLGVKPTASPRELDQTYQRRIAELRASEVEDAPEELAEVEAAYVFLRDPKKRLEYDAKLKEEDDEWEKKNPEMVNYLKSQHRRSRVRRSGSLMDTIWDLLKLFK